MSLQGPFTFNSHGKKQAGPLGTQIHHCNQKGPECVLLEPGTVPLCCFQAGGPWQSHLASLCHCGHSQLAIKMEGRRAGEPTAAPHPWHPKEQIGLLSWKDRRWPRRRIWGTNSYRVC